MCAATHTSETSRLPLLIGFSVVALLTIAQILLVVHLDRAGMVALFHVGWLVHAWCLSLAAFLQVRHRRADQENGSRRKYFRFEYITILATGALGLLLVALALLGKVSRVAYLDWQLFYDRSSNLYFVLLLLTYLRGAYDAERFHRLAQPTRRARLFAFVPLATFSFWMLICGFALMYHLLHLEALIISLGLSLVTVGVLAYDLQKVHGSHQIQLSRGALQKSYTLLIAAIFLLLLGFMGEITKLIGAHLGFFLAFMLGFLVLVACLSLVLFQSVKRRIQRGLVRMFYKSLYDYRAEWQRANQRLLPHQDASSLRSQALAAMIQPMAADRACLLMLDRTQRWFTAASTGAEVPMEAITEPICDWLWRHGQPIRIDQIPVETHQVSLFWQAGFHVAIPLIYDRQLLALVLLGSNAHTYDQEDTEFLEAIAGQITLVLANLKLREQIVESKRLENFSRLSAFVLHDLKNAAFVLSMVLENVEDNIENPEFRQDMVKAMHEATRRIRGLINRLAVPVEQRSLQFHPTDVKELIERLIAQLQLSELPNIELRTELDETPLVLAAPTELESVMRNLLTNAIEAISTKGEISVSLHQQDQHICIEVSDTGMGMSQETLSGKLFAPFYTSKREGLGIGLYQSRMIVEAHQGAIAVESTEGVGTTFRVQLPQGNLTEDTESPRCATRHSGG